jgi:hypothetical protein
MVNDEEMRGLVREEVGNVIAEASEQTQDAVDAEAIVDGTNYPHQEVKDNFFLFLRDLIKSTVTDKFGNLTNDEIGSLPLTIRGYNDISAYLKHAGEFNNEKSLINMSKYFRYVGEIGLATSLSRKGFFLTNAVTTIKKNVSGSGDNSKKKWSLFGQSKKEGEE